MAGEKAGELGAMEALVRNELDVATAFVCPYSDCGVYALHHWGIVVGLAIVSNGTGRAPQPHPRVIMASCEACKREVVFSNGAMVWPQSSVAPSPNVDMPADVRADYEEARLIHDKSSRGAAALLRLALQKLLPEIGATKPEINAAIAELVGQGKIPQTLQRALDVVRVIGNEAVHPGELDLRDDTRTVGSLFTLLNYIVERAITEPKKIEALYQDLPAAKLDGIANRDGAQPGT